MLTDLVAMEIPANISAVNRITVDSPLIMMSESDENSPIAAYEKRYFHPKNITRKEKRFSSWIWRKKGKAQQSTPRTFMKTKGKAGESENDTAKTERSSNPSPSTVKEFSGMSNTGGKDDMGTTEAIIDQFASQSKDCMKNYVGEPSCKSGKIQRNSADVSRSGKVRHTTIKRSTKFKSQVKGTSDQKSKIGEQGDPVAVNCKELVGNKAENNNWMIDNEDTSGVVSPLVVPTFHAKSRASSFNTFIQPNATSKTVFRTSCSDDTGCFSNSSTQSLNLLEADKHNLQSVPVATIPDAGTVEDIKQMLRSPRLCSVCRNESRKRGWLRCKKCCHRSKQNRVHSGPLDELKAYAQSIANSVKKILLLSPGAEQCEEIINNSTQQNNQDENEICSPYADSVPIRSNPEITLHRYLTEINTTNLRDARSKSLLSKSVSYDGRVGSCSEENDRTSSMKWVRRDKDKSWDSFPKLTESNISYADSICLGSEKESRHLIIHDGEKYNKMGRIEKPKTKTSVKQLARVERARTDGDLRGNPLQQSTPSKKIGKDDTKKSLDFHRNRSKTLPEVDADSDEFCEYSQKPQDEPDDSDPIIISRQKVIHEGSPVDPPPNFENKKMEDSKGRKSMFIRSATAPYRNHLSKKDNALGEKLDGAVKSNRSNTKVIFRTNKASTLRKENSLSDKKKVQELTEHPLENVRDDTFEFATMTFARRRSSSCDGRKPLHPKRDEIYRSISWSVVKGSDRGSKQRRAAASVNSHSANQQKEHGEGFSVRVMPSSKLRGQEKKDYQAKKALVADPFLRDYSAENMKFSSQEPTSELVQFEITKDTILPSTEEEVELTQPQGMSYFNSIRYYDNDLENELSPSIEEDVVVEDKGETNLETDSYYCYTETPAIYSQLEGSELMIYTNSVSSLNKIVDNEDVYHDQINEYSEPDVSKKNSSWDRPLQESSSSHVALVQRDRSLESKSSTGFHLMTTVKTSHSDEALMKYSEILEHPSRKQSMYTETDVDTGVIYHLAKRQTTRTHIPRYHDLTNASRGIYTMSGDVRTSTSSNSTISTKSELSECVYTGGFYKDNPFYGNDANSSRSSSNSDKSSSQIYFEPDAISKQASSQLDIYTGSIFNSNQNTISLEQDNANANKTSTVAEVLKDGSTNNSSRSLMGKTQRHLRYRPRSDAITFRNDSAWQYFSSQPNLVCDDGRTYNTSNNSNNWFGMDEFDEPFNQVSILTSKEPLYTDYVAGMRPEFNVRTIEKTESVFHFLKYDDPDDANTSQIFPTSSGHNSSGDSIWYSGLVAGFSDDRPEKVYKRVDESSDQDILTWQCSDDYYTSTVRPRTSKTTYVYGAQGNITHDSNNNHLEDIYTGSYGAQNVPPRVQEPPVQPRQPLIESWYANQPQPKLTSTNFYEQSFDALYTAADSAKKPSSAIFEPPRGTHATTTLFTQDTNPYPGSSVYVTDDCWRKYDHTQRTSDTPYDEPLRPVRLSEAPRQEKPEGYFNYLSNKIADRGFYTGDDDNTYSFEPKVVKEVPQAPVIQEIKTVGGIVCRENVANKEDYAEDINRDLEPGPWTPFSFRREDETRYQSETGSGSDISRAAEALAQGQTLKHMEDNAYAHNRIYDNIGARNKWREMATKKETEVVRTKETTHHRSFQAGDTGKQDHVKNKNFPDVIPDRARGKRIASNMSKPAVTDCSNKSPGSPSVRNRRN